MYGIAEEIEIARLSHIMETETSHKKDLGQYLTPYPIAKYMASLFPETAEVLNILDPGAGIGTLSCAFLERIISEKWNNPKIKITAYDLDPTIIEFLNKNLSIGNSYLKNYDYTVFNTDFLEKTSFEYSFNINEKFSHVIMNPPYKKIPTKSSARGYTRIFGLETVNLYSAFVGAAIAQLKQGGYLSAIIPRSFCNGVYYKPFREFILKNCSIKHIHLFESRNTAFKEESVLQENIIILLQKGTKQESIVISYSDNINFSDLSQKKFDFKSIIKPEDKNMYFNIPTPNQKNFYFSNLLFSFQETGISVSTGTIVDFRVKDFIKKDPEHNTIPLLYPVHFRNFKTQWPKQSKKANAIIREKKIKNMFFPVGYYVVVKRFSTKEEKKRLVASLISPKDIETDAFAFENHLNIFHDNKKGLSKNIAYGLIVWLNTSFLDSQFRLFSGHTQVNATDLRNLPYPSKIQLQKMGEKLQKYHTWQQEIFDNIALEYLNDNYTAANF